jgi:DNA-binding transcriptional LysR family regulator
MNKWRLQKVFCRTLFLSICLQKVNVLPEDRMDTLTRMRAFIAVVEAEGFSAAARKIGRSKALLSKYVRELEDELGSLLLNRTTRQFSLTESGHTYFQRASELIREIDMLQETVRDASGDVKGRIKISAPRTLADTAYGQAFIDFASTHPDIIMDLRLDDRFVDLVEEGYDLAIRISRLEDSSMIAKRLAPFSLILCASPALLAKMPPLITPQELAHLPCILDTNARSLSNWHFESDAGVSINVSIKPRFEVNSPFPARQAALAGLGFVMLPDFVAAPALDSGKLVHVLPQFKFGASGAIYAVYPHRRYLPVKVRVLVDFLANWFKKYEPVQLLPD